MTWRPRLVALDIDGTLLVLDGRLPQSVIDSVGRALGQPLPAEVAPRRAGDPSIVQADPARAREVLGWSSRLELDDMTASAVAGMPWLTAQGYL